MRYRDDDTMARNRSAPRGGDRGGLFNFDDGDERGQRERYRHRQVSDGDYDRQGRYNDRTGGDDLIASDRVEGTPVYGRNGEKLGSIHNFMVEKRGGRVAYAVMKYSSGFLGMDERYYPLSWAELDYDPDRDGYRVNMTEADLDDRRSFNSRGRPVRNRSHDERRDRPYDSNW